MSRELIRSYITIFTKVQRLLSIKNTDTKKSVSKLQWEKTPS
ncbi:hypothetical protein [Clostridium sp. UBA871]